jgi:hypothetical protein
MFICVKRLCNQTPPLSFFDKVYSTIDDILNSVQQYHLQARRAFRVKKMINEDIMLCAVKIIVLLGFVSVFPTICLNHLQLEIHIRVKAN